jgi:peptide/nickel transport system substrate-binding protein
MGDRQQSVGQELPNRRTYLKLLGTGGVATVAGCSGGGDGGDGGGGGTSTGTGTQSDVIPGGHIRTTAISPPMSLSPFAGTSQADYIFPEMMYDRLTSYNRDYEVVPELATEWESNDANDAWTFTLTEDATFSTIDQNVIAEDVKATVEVMQSEDRATGTAVDLGPVASENPVEVEDDYRVTINLSQSDPFYPARLGETGSYFNIVPKTVIDGRFDELESTDFGSGPFELTGFESDDEYRFEGRDWYQEKQGHTLPFVDKFTLKVIPDVVSQANALTGERVDSINTMSPSIRSNVENAGKASVYQYTTSTFTSVVLPTNLELDNGDRPFESLNVRQAMKHALDREAVKAATGNTQTIGHHDPVAPVHPDYADFDEGLEFGTTAQTDEAETLLEEAGYGDGLELPELIYEEQFQTRRGTAVELFQQQMAEVGIEFEIKLVTPDTWLSDYWNQDGTWYASGYASRMEQTTVHQDAFAPDAPWDSGRWDNEYYHKAYNNFSKAERDTDQFKTNFEEAQRISHLKNAWIVFGFLDQQSAANDYVSHFNPGPAANKDFYYDAALSPSAPNGPTTTE